MQARLGALSADQAAAVEALTRGLVNKLLHPPMQALKQAAREGDSARLDVLCDEWSVPAGAGREMEDAPVADPLAGAEPEKSVDAAVIQASAETRR
jgi:glutamyl-tRNA reductase